MNKLHCKDVLPYEFSCDKSSLMIPYIYSHICHTFWFNIKLSNYNAIKKNRNWKIYTVRPFSWMNFLMSSQMTIRCKFKFALITLFILESNIKSKKSIITRNWINYTERAFTGVSSFVNFQISWRCTFIIALITLFLRIWILNYETE